MLNRYADEIERIPQGVKNFREYKIYIFMEIHFMQWKC